MCHWALFINKRKGRPLLLEICDVYLRVIYAYRVCEIF